MHNFEKHVVKKKNKPLGFGHSSATSDQARQQTLNGCQIADIWDFRAKL